MRTTYAITAVALALLLAAAVGGCDSDGEPFEPGADTAAGTDTATTSDTATVTDTGGGAPDTATTPDTAATTDTGGGADTGPAPIPDGQLGGACKPGGVCDEGECWQPRPGAASFCVTPCAGNVDCPDHLRCEEVADFDMKCVPGPRGTGQIGDPCGEGMENGCASALCVEADPAAGIHVDTCTAACESDADCVAPYPVCYGGVNLCLPILSGDLGGRCPDGEQCLEGACTLVPNLGERCTTSCTTDADCGAAYLSCQERATQKYCLMRPRP